VRLHDNKKCFTVYYNLQIFINSQQFNVDETFLCMWYCCIDEMIKIPMTDPILSPTCLASTLLGHELRIRMGSKDCRISIRWMGPVCGYAVIFTAFKHPYPLHATRRKTNPRRIQSFSMRYLWTRLEWYLCMHVRWWKKRGTAKLEKIHENNAWYRGWSWLKNVQIVQLNGILCIFQKIRHKNFIILFLFL